MSLRSARLAVFAALLVVLPLLLGACGGSSSPQTEEDGDSSDKDEDVAETDTAERDTTDIAEREKEAEVEIEEEAVAEGDSEIACQSDTPQSCVGTVRWYCDEALAWQHEDCAPGTCLQVGQAAFCKSDEDGDLDESAETETEAAERDEEDIPEQWVQHICGPNSTLLGEPCIGQSTCPALCAASTESHCFVCNDFVCHYVANDQGTCTDGDLEEEEEEAALPCDPIQDRGNCVGDKTLHECNASTASWHLVECSPDTCIEDSEGAHCGAATDGDIEDFDCAPGTFSGGAHLAVDTGVTGRLLTNQGERTSTALKVCNNGTAALSLKGYRLLGYGDGGFDLSDPPAFPITLEPGASLDVNLEAGWPKSGLFFTTLRFLTDTATAPFVDAELRLDSLPIGRLTTTPAQVLPFSISLHDQQSLLVKNEGDATLGLLGANLSNADYWITSTSDPVPSVLAPGQSFTMRFSKDDGDLTTTLSLPWICPIRGALSSTVSLTSGGGPFCAVSRLSQASLSARPLEALWLSALDSSDPGATSPLYLWDIKEVPNGSRAAMIKDQAGQNITGGYTAETLPRFVPDMPGTYVLSLALAENDARCLGLSLPTELHVVALARAALHITLTWSKAGGDHDLHLLRPGASFSRFDSTNAGDCHAANCYTARESQGDCPARGCPGPQLAPDWGIGGARFDDPQLLAKDENGKGPEVIALDALSQGDYQVIVENVAGGTDTDFDLDIALNGVPTAHYTDRIADGNCHHEVLALIRVDAQGQALVVPTRSFAASGCVRR